MSGETTIRVSRCLDEIRQGNAAARSDLIAYAVRRLERLARRMAADYPRLRGWLDADDVLQNSLVRLERALDAQTPESALHFFRLSALQIRRELLDISRLAATGPESPRLPAGGEGDARIEAIADSTYEPSRLADWTEFHRAIAELPEEPRQIADLLYYHELSQSDAAETLGMPIRTLKRRWQQIRLQLHATFQRALGK